MQYCSRCGAFIGSARSCYDYGKRRLTKRLKRIAAVAVALSVIARCGGLPVSPAMAQQTTPTTLAPPSLKWGGGAFQVPSPVQIVGYDSGTLLPCIIGYSATCALSTTAGGGGGGGTSSAFSAAFPSNGTAAGLSDGTNMQPFRGDTTNGLWVNVKTSVLPTGAALEAGGNLAQLVTDSGAPGATACATDTSSCNFNQLFQRIAQRLTTINTTLGTPMQATGGTVGLVAGTALVGKFGTDLTTPGTTNLVSAGFSQQVADTPTVQNAAYASGNCIGGFRPVTISVNNGQSGFITNFRIVSLGGSTPTITIYLFDSNPSSSTCTDKSTFTLNSADVDKLIASPTAVTLAAPTGTTVTVAAQDYSPPRPFIAGGATNSGVKAMYYALVSGSTFTPATTTDIHTRVGAVLN